MLCKIIICYKMKLISNQIEEWYVEKIFKAKYFVLICFFTVHALFIIDDRGAESIWFHNGCRYNRCNDANVCRRNGVVRQKGDWRQFGCWKRSDLLHQSRKRDANPPDRGDRRRSIDDLHDWWQSTAIGAKGYPQKPIDWPAYFSSSASGTLDQSTDDVFYSLLIWCFRLVCVNNDDFCDIVSSQNWIIKKDHFILKWSFSPYDK